MTELISGPPPRYTNKSKIEWVADCNCQVVSVSFMDHKNRPCTKHSIEYCPKHAAADEMFVALRFARSVIKSRESWSYRCREIIDGAITRAGGSKEEDLYK